MIATDLRILRTDSSHPDFRTLVAALDKDLAIRDGEDHGFYAQYNGIDMIHHAVVAYIDDVAVSCGAFKPFEAGSVEIKRMYTLPEYRGQGIAAQVLAELERWAAEEGYRACVLETGRKQPEAIRLYEKCGYTLIPNYGQYAGVDNSVCFEKKLISKEAY